MIGGEWWVQHRGNSETIGFHYDKDEAFASIHWEMRYPYISTITYLSDIGSPTLIINQTTPDGNQEIPIIPHVAKLVYPRGKYLQVELFTMDTEHVNIEYALGTNMYMNTSET